MGEGSGPALLSPPHFQARGPHRRGVSCEGTQSSPQSVGPGRLPEGNEQKQLGHWPR